MTKPTSRRSAKVTPRPEPEPDTNGTPTAETEPSSEGTSTDSTTWTVVDMGGTIYTVKLAGRGRISYGTMPRGSTEVRIYRNETTKTFDAVIPNAQLVWSDRCSIKVMTPKPTKATSVASSYPTPYKTYEVDEDRLAESIVEALVKAKDEGYEGF